MIDSIRRNARRLALGGALALVLGLAGGAGAANYTVDPKTGKKLLAIQEMLQAEQYDQAEQLLESFNIKKLNDYEASIVYQFLGYVTANQERYEEAASHFENCLERQGLPPPAQLSTRFSLAQINMALERWEDAVRHFQIWFQTAENPNSSAYYVLAAAYYQWGKPAEALAPAKKAVELGGVTPKQSWLQLLLALHMEKKEYKEALPLLEKLVTLYPKKSYWIQIAAVYSELGEDKKSLAAQQLAYHQGLLTTDRELTRMAQMYLYHDLPYRAAQVMKTGLADGSIESTEKAWRLLGDSWLAAREYDLALEPLATAASLSDDGDLYVRLGQVYIQREEWEPAVGALRQALDKGGLRDEGDAHLLIGIARYNQKQIEAARASFARARNEEKTRQAADRWLQHIAREEQS
jgi:tetratricopeptide (TPR) repeat protein